MVNPVPGRLISTPFGRRGSHWSCQRNSSGQGIHTGADWAAPSGTPIVAPIAGTIRHRSYGSAFGPNQFAISPSAGMPFANGEVFFAHTLDRLRDGTVVAVGQQIARVGAMGNATGPHLHMEYMPNTKNTWRCGIHADPAPIVAHGGGSSSPSNPPSSAGGPYVTANIYTDKLGFGEPTNGDQHSDTVKELQERLNRIRLTGGANLPVTGKYHTMTDAEVRKWQEQIVKNPPDPAGRSYLGPRQTAAMFPSPPYVIHDRGLPAISRSGSTTPNPPPAPNPPPTASWFVPASLDALRKEIDARWPGRSKASDGTIGDTAHSRSQSEHNPVGHQFGPKFGTPGAVHAMDITTRDIDGEKIIKDWLLRDPRVWYVIHKARIWSKTHNWVERPYSGDPHNAHFHVSLRADDQADAVRAEQDTRKWEKGGVGICDACGQRLPGNG